MSSVLHEVEVELYQAIRKFPDMHSPHEGLAVIHEEYLELQKHVYGNMGRTLEARNEAIQIAAMAVRYVCDLFEQ